MSRCRTRRRIAERLAPRPCVRLLEPPGVVPGVPDLRSPNGVRTRVSTLRGWCPRPLDDGTVGRGPAGSVATAPRRPRDPRVRSRPGHGACPVHSRVPRSITDGPPTGHRGVSIGCGPCATARDAAGSSLARPCSRSRSPRSWPGSVSLRPSGPHRPHRRRQRLPASRRSITSSSSCRRTARSTTTSGRIRAPTASPGPTAGGTSASRIRSSIVALAPYHSTDVLRCRAARTTTRRRCATSTGAR